MPEIATCGHPFTAGYVSETAVRRMIFRLRPDLPRYDKHQAQLERMTKQLLEARRRRQRSIVVQEIAQTAVPVLRDLEAMLEEQNEPDFLHRPTEYAYNTIRQIIENLYTHYIGSAPVPTLAPDGAGGIIAEWKSGRRIVRLVISSDQDGKSYVYSRELSRSLVDYSVSSLILAQQLRSIFAD